MASTDLDTVTLVNLATGERFEQWESISITSEFLTPCDSWSLEAGAEIAGPELAARLARFDPAHPRSPTIQILVNDKPQITGFVGRISVKTSRGGSRVKLSGRDILGPVVSGNIDPRTPIAKETTIEKLVELVIKDQFGYDFAITGDDRGDIAIGTSSAKKKKYESRHKRDLTIKDIKPHDNEGAFTYLSRILTHYGYWLWASPDGSSVVVGGPDYDQPPSYSIKSVRDPHGTGAGKGNTVEEAEFSLDFEDQPSAVYVRGVDGGAGTKGKVVGMSLNSAQPLMVPVYICDKDAKSKEQAERIAETFLARKRKDMLQYNVTVAGLSDRAPGANNGNVWNTNTVVDITDENTGTSGSMWIESRTLRKTRQGCFTDLKCIPLGTLLLDWQPGKVPPEPVPFPKVQSMSGKSAPGRSDSSYGGTIWDDLAGVGKDSLKFFQRKG